MKIKVVIALVLALVTLSTLIMPVFASTDKGELTSNWDPGDPGTGTASLRTGQDGSLNVTVMLKGTYTDSTFTVYLYSVDYSVSYFLGSLTTDAKGNGKFSGVHNGPFPSGEKTFIVRLQYTSYYAFTTENLTVTFK